MTKTPAPKRAILVRVAIDQTYGRWNGPCDPTTGDFVYVPIPQEKPNTDEMARTYRPSVDSALRRFSERCGIQVELPPHLHGERTHLDPDFDFLTYGDTADRGRRLADFERGDWVVFYAGLRSIRAEQRLVYALIGMLVVDRVERVGDIPPDRFDHNAHTRLHKRTESDVVVSGQRSVSGRFERYLDIGELRDGSYRVRRDLLDAWGDLSVRDGWIQRSANPPIFRDPHRFAKWLAAQAPQIVASNHD
jgi:hypothetical protein